jgi:hypothetical protein
MDRIKCIILIFLPALIPFAGMGQGVLVSSELNLRNDYAYEFVGANDKETMLFRDRAFRYEVNAFDDQMRLKWERELDFEQRKIEMAGTVYDDTSFHIFYSYRDRGKRTLKVNKYDNRAFLMDSMTLIVDEQMASGAKWRFARSENREKVLLFGPADRREVRFICYDVPTMSMMWDLSVPFVDTLSGKDFKQLLLSDAGDMYMVLEVKQGGLLRQNYEQQLWLFSQGMNGLTKVEVNIGEWFADDTRYIYDNVNEQLIGVSTLSEKTDGRVKGLIWTRVNNRTKAVTMQEVDMLNPELLQDIHGQETRYPNNIQDFILRDLILREDGGVVVSMELVKEYSRKPAYPYSNIRNDNPMNYRRWVDYYFEDLLLMNYGPNGEREWDAVLRKRQYSQDDEGMYSSYYLFKTPSFLHLVYNDEIRNENTVSEYVINGDGDYVRNSLLSTASQRLRLRFRDAVQVSSRSFIVPSERNSKLMLVKFIY